MKLLKVGCGCIVLVTEEADTLEKSVARRLEDCRGSDGSSGPRIGPPHVLSTFIDSANLKPDKVQQLSASESLSMLSELSQLVDDGHQFRVVQHVLKGIVK